LRADRNTILPALPEARLLLADLRPENADMAAIKRGRFRCEDRDCRCLVARFGSCARRERLIDQGITKCDDLSEPLIDSFLDVHCKDLRTTSGFYSPRPNAQALLKWLFVYLIVIKRLPAETKSD
jgi:hypothetical protein